MAKSERTSRATIVNHAGGQELEHREVLDDNLLPPAAELEKYCQLGPDVLPWLMARAEKEQEFRHGITQRKMLLIEKSEKGERQMNRMGLTYGFLFLVLGILYSAFLIHDGFTVVGSIFSGILLLAGAALLMNRHAAIPKDPNKK